MMKYMLVILFIVSVFCSLQQTAASKYKEKPVKDSSNWENEVYEVYDEKEGDTEYGELEERLCYSCSFFWSQGHSSGMEDCVGMENSADLPKVLCNGACGVVYSGDEVSHFSLSRACIPNCKDYVDEYGAMKCCHSSLCNDD